MIAPRERSFQRIPFWRLREEFHMQGYFDSEVADACGIKVGTMSTRMQGRSPWRADEVSRICELLDIPRERVGEYFFPDVESEAAKKPGGAGTPTSFRVTG